jgi:bifunctional non-homologous end joining protein LigD
MKNESTTLYFKQGSSNKVYTAKLLGHEATDEWTVTFAYGRRGGPMKAGVKTKDPVSYEKAKVIFDKLVHAKQLKGYTTGKDAVAYTDNPNAGKDTGFRPQLLNEVTYEEAEDFYKATMPSVAVQIKWDGERRAAILTKGEDNVFTNRKGQAKGTAQTIDEACTKLISNRPVIFGFELDCEDMGEYLVIFDILRVNDVDMRHQPFAQRAEALIVLRELITAEGLGDQLKVEVPTYPTSLKDFRWFIEHCRAHNEEGVVIRDASAPYTPGRPNSGGPCLKLKFIGEATCIVMGHSDGKRSIEVGVRGVAPPFTKMYMPIGRVTIPPNYDIPAMGQLVEIRYMNIMKGEGAKLFQPRYKGVRTDKTDADSYSSLKFKKEV